MRKVYVVVDADHGKALKAFVSEYKANDYADDCYTRNGVDTRIDEVWFNEHED